MTCMYNKWLDGAMLYLLRPWIFAQKVYGLNCHYNKLFVNGQYMKKKMTCNKTVARKNRCVRTMHF